MRKSLVYRRNSHPFTAILLERSLAQDGGAGLSTSNF